MLVPDQEKSERGMQRRKSAGGNLLHCCCICGKLDVWGGSWSTYCSVKDMDDSAPIPKFCSFQCQTLGGPEARNVTNDMRQKAKDAEWREPETKWREATQREKYTAAAYEQSRKHKPRS